MPRFAAFAVLFAPLALAACGTPQTSRSAYDYMPPGKSAEAAETATADSPGNAARTPPGRQASLPPRPEPPPEPPHLEELRGLDAAQLTKLLGKPTLLRTEDSMQMWQYRGESCVLHLFLYPPSGSPNGEKRVQYVEARPRQTGAPAATSGPSDCLATLVGTQRLRS